MVVRRACIVAPDGRGVGASPAHAQFKHYESDNPSFWLHPPPDWFLGDETEAQKGLAPIAGPATPTDAAELEKNLSNDQAAARLQGRALWARACRKRVRWRGATTARCSSAPSERRTSTPSRTKAARSTVKTILKGLNMPTGVAFENGSLYVVGDRQIAPLRQGRGRIWTRCRSRSWSMTTCRPTHRTDGNISPTISKGCVLHPFRAALQHRHPAHQQLADTAG